LNSVSPWPNWPNSLSPKDHTLPFTSSSRVCL